MAPIDGIPSDVDRIAGPLIITFMLGSILYGVSVLQVYIYYMSFPNDRKLVKSLVYTVFILDTTQTIIFFRDAFIIFGSGFGDMKNLRAAHLSGISVPILTGLVSILVQGFYSYQIKVISRTWILPTIIFSIALTQFISSVYEGVLIFQINNSAVLQARTLVPCTIWLAGSALCDTLIAIVMTTYLLKASAGLKGNPLIRRLVRLVIETGSLTAAVATIDCVLFIAVQKYPFHMLPSRCLAKLYANTLMVILNSRLRIVGSRDEAKLSPGHMYSGWSQSLDIRFKHPTSGQSTRNLTVPVGVESHSSRNTASRDHDESERLDLPKVVELNDLDGNKRDHDTEISSKLHHRTLQDEE
ncbi:hypothetical protein Moror_4539 [Moniliophthora roreri MCA 2997]|uniref:DUF6534 domain-containing protein n=1 Tax=Moniliophthora roreri (strain MCA 2997) TaxID=1381753 RepID=V2WZW6_MONRO|nr:hypothetical protein Moror_4539 [Moniliophthora roreri MCA 2997]